ncbi:FAD-binding oxidoreductase [Bizionia saleffrena]|uniref:FAD-binding oxidoreductase n=1 Tax=Bizionia saleffrena TaxID=291189 RepID=A0A8H2QJ99_9FLAO|nr:FAD-dependent oxidoreductase [Bizionia saleffrena]TYB74129.1 FAD-binding oxidoreductase [Bizionia saleffrena]
MNLSYWERQSWLSNIDFTIIGSGIVGLTCALHLKSKYPKATILIVEQGVMPQGASTKNAGFACFGSLSEILDDLKHHSEEEVVALITQRVEGLKLLKHTLGEQAIGYKHYGGYELFTHNETNTYETCLQKKESINSLLKPLFNAPVFSVKNNSFGFENIKNHYVFNAFEGQLNTGKLMTTLLHKVQASGIKILNSVTVEVISDCGNKVSLKTNSFEFSSQKVCIATNGFASKILQTDVVKPARAQVLITKPIANLPFKGTFHIDKGYYYFRTINDRVLFGGGRHLDFKTEETTRFGQTPLIQNTLDSLLKRVILPTTAFEIDMRWSGIMGVGNKKKPLLKQVSNNVYCGVRLGGMGIAIGSLIGKQLAELTT